MYTLYSTKAWTLFEICAPLEIEITGQGTDKIRKINYIYTEEYKAKLNWYNLKKQKQKLITNIEIKNRI